MYTVKIEKFEGPLDLLLELIELRKLEVTNISLAEVTDQFLSYLKSSEEISISNLANFIVVASRLILIKSKALLPFLELTQEEEDDIVDLEKQLREYQKFRDAAKALGELFNQKNICFTREYKEIPINLFYPPQNINSQALSDIFKRVLSENPPVIELPRNILKSKISIEDKIKHIGRLIKERIELSFHSLHAANQEKEHIVANFLAILELTRQKILVIEQKEIFGEIKLMKI